MIPNDFSGAASGRNPMVQNSLIRAIRGPVLLITLGILVWIDFAGKISFWRTWPVLMIVYGVLRLVEHLA